MDYKSKIGYAFNYMNKEIIIFTIVGIIILAVTLFINTTLTIILFILILLISVIGILMMKFVLGIVVKIEGKNIRIYKTDSFALKPGNNEMIITYGRNLHASINITKENISKMRKITDSSEIKKIPRLHKRINVGAGGRHGAGSGAGIMFHLNKENLEKVSFISDFNRLVEITVKKIKVRKPYLLGKEESIILTNFKILASVQNLDEFIRVLKKKN